MNPVAKPTSASAPKCHRCKMDGLSDCRPQSEWHPCVYVEAIDGHSQTLCCCDKEGERICAEDI